MKCNLNYKNNTIIFPEQQFEIKFDPDSSPKAWEHYKKVYSDSNYLKPMFENDFIYSGNEYLRLIRYIKNNMPDARTKKHEIYMEFGGDCDFNFNAKKVKVFKEKIYEEDKELLEICSKNHHMLHNFSLMPRTGALNNIKGSGYDRFDTFIYRLNDFFINEESNLRNRLSKSTNGKILISFLESFENIYDYCDNMYFLKSKSFVEYLIVRGNSDLKTKDDFRKYLKLACVYWVLKSNAINQKEFNHENIDSILESYYK